MSVSCAKGRGGGMHDAEALVASVSVALDKSRTQCMKAIEQVDSGINISLYIHTRLRA
jgi:hypothetical protein